MKLALGTAQFGLKYGIANKFGKLKKFQQKKILKFAKESRIDMLDTAVNYGSSEKTLGKIGVNEFKIITKIPPFPNKIKNINEFIQKNVEQSLKKLKINCLYGLLLHNSNDILRFDGKVIKCLKQLKKNKLIKKYGVSIYSPNELTKVLKYTSVDIVQAPINLLDRRLEKSGWLNRLKKKNIEIHARSIFLQGLLLLPPKKILRKFSKWKNIWSMWYDWQFKHPKQTALEICFGYVKSLKQVDRIVVGVDSFEQIKEIENIRKKYRQKKYPNLSIDDKKILHPSNWRKL